MSGEGPIEETDGIVERTYKLDRSFAELLEYEADSRETTPAKILQESLTDGFYVAFKDVDEATTKLKYIDPWGSEGSSITEVSEPGDETPENIRLYKKLRETFPPVSAGIEYAKSFSSGSGFETTIEDASDSHQKEVQEEIRKLNKNIFMDDVTLGLNTILDIMIDAALTEGVGAAEIVYVNKDAEDESKWLTSVVNPAEGKPSFKKKKMTDEDWKSLGGVEQLKIIANAYHRLKPYRDPDTWEIQYYTVDEGATDSSSPIKLLPWQVLWLSWNRRGHKIKGLSHVKSVASTADLLQRILRDLGISFDRWADKKYFFVLGSEKSGRSWAPQHIRNFLVDVRTMTASNGTGVAVPAGFDVKDIGGEVYDGGQIIDYLLTMITAGMRYPRTFLEQGKTQEGDKAWLAWLVTYGRFQDQLRQAVESQLWKRHIYCKFGMMQRISKQGVPVEDQEMRVAYVPTMQWKSEGKWHRETKLKMLSGLLNVANPISPELKIQVELDMAQTLGYSELTLEKSKKLIDLDTDTELLNRQSDLILAQMKLEVMAKALEDKAHLAEGMEPVLPFISAPEEEEEEKPEFGEENRPPPKPGARQKGGVSRTTKESGKKSQKGKAKDPGGIRKAA